MNAIELAEHWRDRRLRRRVLMMLYAARAVPQSGWCGGRLLYDVAAAALPAAERFEDERHLLALLRDLASAGYVEERDDRTHAWQPAGIEWTRYRITARGTALVTEALDPDPLVEDARLRRG